MKTGVLRRARAVSVDHRADPRHAAVRSMRCTGPARLFCVATDLLALTLLEAPGEMGCRHRRRQLAALRRAAGFGGPHAAFIACKDAFKRSMPGRMIGVSVDCARAAGLPADAADARAAHPAREGDLEHLHGAGAAGGDGQRCTRFITGPKGLKAIAERSTSAIRGGVEQSASRSTRPPRPTTCGRSCTSSRRRRASPTSLDYPALERELGPAYPAARADEPVPRRTRSSTRITPRWR
jgi:hypothetical protein